MRVLLVVTGLVASVLLTLGAGVSPARADDDTYAPSVPTSCHIGTPRIAVGQRVVLEVDVSSNSTTPLSGRVDLVITRGGAARAARAVVAGVVWSKSVRFEGTPLRVLGPRLPRGSYAVRMAFTPDDGSFDGCVNTAGLVIGGPTDNGSDGPDHGVLPDTGGPHLYLLLLGAALVAGGAGVLAQGRRARTRAAA